MEKLVQKLESLIELPCFSGSTNPIIVPENGEFMLMYVPTWHMKTFVDMSFSNF